MRVINERDYSELLSLTEELIEDISDSIAIAFQIKEVLERANCHSLQLENQDLDNSLLAS
jgi:hypothetical protein